MAEASIPALRRVVEDHRRQTNWALERNDWLVCRRHLRALDAFEEVLDWLDGLDDPLTHPVAQAVTRALVPYPTMEES